MHLANHSLNIHHHPNQKRAYHFGGRKLPSPG